MRDTLLRYKQKTATSETNSCCVCNVDHDSKIGILAQPQFHSGQPQMFLAELKMSRLGWKQEILAVAHRLSAFLGMGVWTLKTMAED